MASAGLSPAATSRFSFCIEDSRPECLVLEETPEKETQKETEKETEERTAMQQQAGPRRGLVASILLAQAEGKRVLLLRRVQGAVC